MRVVLGLSASPNVYTLYIIFVSYLFIDLTPCPIISCTLVLHFEVFSIFQLSFCFIFLRLCDVVVCILFFGYLPCCVVCCDIMCRCGLWHRTLHICPVTPDVLSFPICEYVIICPFINPIASGTFFLCDCSCCIRLWISKVGFWSFFSYLLLFLFLFSFFQLCDVCEAPLLSQVTCLCGVYMWCEDLSLSSLLLILFLWFFPVSLHVFSIFTYLILSILFSSVLIVRLSCIVVECYSHYIVIFHNIISPSFLFSFSCFSVIRVYRLFSVFHLFSIY